MIDLQSSVFEQYPIVVVASALISVLLASSYWISTSATTSNNVTVTVTRTPGKPMPPSRAPAPAPAPPPPNGTAKTKRPPHVRSYLPYLGSALEMGGGIIDFIRRNSRKLGDTPVFTAFVMGDQCVFLADPELLTCVYQGRYQKYLDVLSLQKQFVANVLNASPQQLDELFSDDTLKLALPQYHHFLFKGEELKSSMTKVQDIFLDLLPQLVADVASEKSRTENDVIAKKEWKRHNLFDMVRRLIFQASVGPLVSNSLVGKDVVDNLVAEFCAFDAGIIALFNKVPAFVIRNVIQAREKLYARLQTCESFWPMASPLMKERKEKLPLSLESLDTANLGVLWASVGNSVPAVFWTLLLLLEDKNAWNACLAQVETIISKRTSAEKNDSKLFTLEELDEMTFLQSAFWEALRLYQGNFSARTVKQRFSLETSQGEYYSIEKGSKIMPFWGILHMDPHVFENPEKFVYDRFVDSTKVFSYKSGKKLTHSPPVVAFGGGSHLCPGRKFISYEARLFVAMLMQNFDMQLPDDYRRPGVNAAMQGIGVSQPDSDAGVEIRLRC